MGGKGRENEVNLSNKSYEIKIKTKSRHHFPPKLRKLHLIHSRNIWSMYGLIIPNSSLLPMGTNSTFKITMLNAIKSLSTHTGGILGHFIQTNQTY